MFRTISALLLGIIAGVSGAASDALHDLKPYPPPEDGMQRLVFRVPVMADEADRQVEVVVGRTMSVDCNLTRFIGSLEQRTASGWGYPYYEVSELRGPATTLMACPEGAPRREQFVRVRGEGFFVRYNSKLPVVVYVPTEFEVRYRVWAPLGEVGHAKPE
jgi:ecotin